jgi:hypothetical protein
MPLGRQRRRLFVPGPGNLSLAGSDGGVARLEQEREGVAVL